MFEEKIKQVIAKATKLPRKQITLMKPPRPEFGDYSFTCFGLAKKQKQRSQDIARSLTGKLRKKLPKQVSRVEAVGGYVNFFINKEAMAKKVIETVLKEKAKFGDGNKKGKVMIEFCHANTHKAFHIGHTRNIALGESISRILEKMGFKVTRVNYQGDIGMHVAKTLWGLKNLKKLKLKAPKDEIEKGKWLGIVYAKANKLIKGKEAEEKINGINQKLYAGDKKLKDLWKKTRKWSINYFEKIIYPDFGVKFDRFYFESQVEKQGVKIAKELLKKKLAIVSDRAIVMDLKNHGLDIFLILKSDGTPLYSTKDIYLAELQNKEFHPDKILHVVGSEQNLYFKQLFKTFEIINPGIAKKQSHISYELVILPSGKMASREGIVVLYDDTLNKLIDLAKKEIKKRDKKIKDKELERRARKIALGAIKYAMLSQNTNKVIVFNESEVVSFEGNTGPYLMYTYARASSILRKAENAKTKAKEKKQASFEKLDDSEFRLVKQVSEFPEILKSAHRQLNPSVIANYSFRLAQNFNEFYHSCPVLKAKPEVRERRLGLVRVMRQVLENALTILGIEVLEEM